MKDFSKQELKEMLMNTIKIYKKMQYSNGHEYFTEPDYLEKIFTQNDAKRMDEIIKKFEM